MEMTVEMLQENFTKQKDEIKGMIDTLVKAESTESNKAIGELKTKLSEVEKALADLTTERQSQGQFGLPGLEYEKKNWSWQRFWKGLYEHAAKVSTDPWKEASFEKRVCDDYMKRRGMNAGDGSEGGFLVAPEITNEIIDMAVPNMPIMTIPGVRKLVGLRGDLPVPAQTGKSTGYWVGEESKPTESTPSFGLKTLKPKKVGAYSKQSNRLIYQTGGLAETLIKQIISEAVAEKMNEGLIRGTGSEYQPKGLLSHTGMTAGPVVGATGGRFTIDHAAAMQQYLAAADEQRDTPTYGYLMRPEVLWGMRRERATTASGASAKVGLPIVPGQPFLGMSQLEDILGAAIRHTTQIAATGSKSTTTTGLSKVVYGDWSKFWIGLWQDMRFKVSDVAGDGSGGSAFLQDQLYFVAFVECDCMLMRESAMCLTSDALCTESAWS